MDNQLVTQPAIRFILISVLSSDNPLSLSPGSVSPRDYGFDFDEDELAYELHAAAPAGLAEEPIYDIEAGEFETLYRWFC